MRAGWLGRTLAMLGAAGALGSGMAISAEAETRSPGLWPFAASSPWNTPLGTGAQYSDPECTASIRSSASTWPPPYINTKYQSFPVYQATNLDPMKRVYLDEVNDNSPPQPTPAPKYIGDFRIPLNAGPVGEGSDQSWVVIQPASQGQQISLDLWRGKNWPAFVNAGQAGRHDLVTGDGFRPLAGYGPRAANASFLGGLIRKWELEAGSIRHVLALSLPHAYMNIEGPIPPATNQDAYDQDYTGPIHMGQLMAIPPEISIDSLNLTSATGTKVAQALKTYGAYLVDGSGNMALYAEPNADALVAPARAGNPSDITKITAALSCVSNNAPGNWGGGGTPLAPPAPPFG